MKFTSALLALFFAASEARSNLMSKAVKVNGSRMLDDAIITGSKSIQFDQCVSVTTQPYNNNIFYNEYNLQAAQNGAIQSQKSFVIFNVCETDSECAYSSQNNLYMVDLGTYVRATMPYLPTKESRYCSVCEMSEEYCQQAYEAKDQAQQQYYEYQQQQQGYQGQYQQGQGQYQQGQGQQYQQGAQQQNGQYQQQQYNNGGNRFLQNYAYNSYNSQAYGDNGVEQVTCSECISRQCFDENFAEQGGQGQYYQNGYQDANQEGAEGQEEYYQNGYYQQGAQQQDVDMEKVSEFIGEISQCMELDYQWNGQQVYAGFICNEQGSGVEIGVFLDPYCTIYTSQITFRNAVANDGNNEGFMFLYNSQDIVTYPFTNDIDCSDTLTFATPWGAYNNNGYYAQTSPSQYCTNLFQGTAMDLNDCDGNNVQDNQQNDYTYNGYYANDEADYYANYNFYNYVLSQNDLADTTKVCATVKSLRGEANSVYDSSSGGSLYDYSSSRKKTNNNRISFDGEKKGLKLFGLITGMVVALVAILFFCKDFCCFESSFDSKKEQLVIEGDKVYAREM